VFIRSLLSRQASRVGSLPARGGLHRFHSGFARDSITVTPVLAYYLLSGSTGHERDSLLVRNLKRGNAARFCHGPLPIANSCSTTFWSVVRPLTRRSPAAAHVPAAPPFNEGTHQLISLQYNPGISLAEPPPGAAGRSSLRSRR